jgi:hypothetical protein
MAERCLLIDNDLFVLLSGAELLDAALAEFGFEPVAWLTSSP